MIKVLIADDHKIFLDGLEAVLENEPDIKVVSRCLNGRFAVASIQALMNTGRESLDIVVLDINMPLLDGIEVTRFIKANYPELKVLMLTMFRKIEFIKQLKNEGIDGYMLKESGIEEFVIAIRRLHQGKTYYSPNVMDTILDHFAQEEETEEAILTDREKEVIVQIGLGRQAKQISEVLNIAQTTVDTHRRNILSKLNLSNSLELVRYAIFNGYIEKPDDN